MRTDMGTLVLLHGVYSGAETWEDFRTLVSTDPAMEDLSIHTFAYPSPKFRLPLWRRIPDLDTIARSFREFLSTDIDRDSPIVILAHSQGGLIAQEYLRQSVENGRARELQRIKKLILVATPNSGSDYLLTLRRVFLGRWQTQERSIRPLDAKVAETHSVVLKRIVNATSNTDYECIVPVHAFAAAEDAVVRRSSAFGAFPSTGVIPGDHSSVVSPSSLTDQRYSSIKREIRAAFPAADNEQRLEKAPKEIPVDHSEFVAELTVPDGSIMLPGQDFVKSWVIRNAGETPWIGRSLRRMGAGSAPGMIVAPHVVAIPTTMPGETVQIDIPMTAPTVAAFTTCLYKMIDASGNLCFPDRHPAGLSVVIHVIANSSST